jgi:hypothetical protein
MSRDDDLYKQLIAYHTYLTALYRLHQRSLMLRSLSSQEQAPPRIQVAATGRYPVLVYVRRRLSHTLYALAQAIDPDPARAEEDATDGSVVDVVLHESQMDFVQEEHHGKKSRADD